MIVFTSSTLNNYIKQHPKAAEQLRAWLKTTEAANWANANELKQELGTASIITTPFNTTRVVFNIKGNDYRLAVDILFSKRTLFITWFGTHKEYDTIDFTQYQRPSDQK